MEQHDDLQPPNPGTKTITAIIQPVEFRLLLHCRAIQHGGEHALAARHCPAHQHAAYTATCSLA